MKKEKEEPGTGDWIVWLAIILVCLGMPIAARSLPARESRYQIRIKIADWPATITLSSDRENGTPGNGKCIAELRCVARFAHPLKRVRIQYGPVSNHPPSCEGTGSRMVAELTQNGQVLTPTRCEPLPNGTILSF